MNIRIYKYKIKLVQASFLIHWGHFLRMRSQCSSLHDIHPLLALSPFSYRRENIYILPKNWWSCRIGSNRALWIDSKRFDELQKKTLFYKWLQKTLYLFEKKNEIGKRIVALFSNLKESIERIKMVNEFKHTVVHPPRPNPIQICARV